MKYTKEEILSKVDHTLLKPEATWPQIQALCDDAIKYHTASVCINTCYVKQAVEYMAGRIPVCCALWCSWPSTSVLIQQAAALQLLADFLQHGG